MIADLLDRPPLLLVVGMHRSGTSLLGGLLQRLGVSLPGETIQGDQHNPDGYFEWKEVVDIQERLLIDLQRWWPAPQGTLALPDRWLEHPASSEAISQLRTLLVGEAAHQQSLWAIKDPRCSRLLPLWIRLARELEIPLRIVLALRDPAEVTASLLSRDRLVTHMDINRAQQIWWRHNLEPLHILRNENHSFTIVDYGSWFSRPQIQLEGLVRILPELKPSPAQLAAALAFIEPAHRRSFEHADASALDSDVKKLYCLLLRKSMPRRLPPSTPPSRLRRAQKIPSLGINLKNNPAAWSAWIEQYRCFPAPRIFDLPALAADPRLFVCGLTWMDLEPHLLLQRIPLLGLSARKFDIERSEIHQLCFQPDDSFDGTLNTLTLNLELPSQERATHWLAHLNSQQVILDPDPARVLLMRALDLPAWWLDPDTQANGWLQQPMAVDPFQWAARLGLAPPPADDVILLGSAGATFERDLAAIARKNPVAVQVQPAIAYYPGWNDLLIREPVVGLLRAGWLQKAANTAASLVYAGTDVPPSWQLLHASSPCMALPEDASAAELIAQYFRRPLMALAEDRPKPPVLKVLQWQDPKCESYSPLAAVVVSLFNYSDRITNALESVREQTQQGLELIVVDDDSNDPSLAVAEAWMESCIKAANHPIVRMSLLHHQSNVGLATARNTAFAAAQAPWCFVLDADNELFPNAVASCLALAESQSSKLAVVHPLLAVEADAGRPDEQRTLVRSQSWQRERFCFENNVDAMALVRSSAWEAVGGYTHIEGGWEDYDFWCKLVSAGYYGIQCPEILAAYHSHEQSMSHCATNRSWHSLSRTLQQRHPWLHLPLASTED